MRRLVLAVTAVLLAVSCRPREASRSAAGAPFGTLVVVMPSDADLLLPPVATTQLASHITEQIFPRLADLTMALTTIGDSSFVPVIARRWEHPDSLTIVFHLDPRARWQDGTPITADDVVYTFGVYNDTLTRSPFRVNLARIASVTRTDSLTVTFRFTRNYPEQLFDATYQMKLMPKHLLDTIPNERLAASSFAHDPAVGAGPFRFAHWEPGAEIAIEADTTWFLGRPRLARIVWRIMPDVSASVSALLAGEADAMEVIPQRDEIERAQRSPDLRLVPYPSPFIAGLAFNLRRPLFADRELRRALVRAINRETITQSVFGPYAEVPRGALSRIAWAAEGAPEQLPWDTAAAARTLDSLGWRRGADGIRRRGSQRLAFSLQVPTTSRSRQEAAILVQDQLKQAGVDVRIEPLEYSVFERRGHSNDFDVTFVSRTLDPSPNTLSQFWSSSAIARKPGDAGDNQGAYSSPAFDSLFALASATSDMRQALPRWHAALRQLNDDAPAIFLFSLRNNAAIHKRFQDVTIRADSWLATVATWSVAPDQRLPRDR